MYVYTYTHKNKRDPNIKAYTMWSVYTNESAGIKRLSDDPKRVVYYHVADKLFFHVLSFLRRICVLIWSKSDKDGENDGSQRRERCR